MAPSNISLKVILKVGLPKVSTPNMKSLMMYISLLKYHLPNGSIEAELAFSSSFRDSS